MNRQRRGDGSIYMLGGCDSEFEGEMMYYAPAFEIVDNLMTMAGDVSVKIPRSHFLPSCPKYELKIDPLVPNVVGCY